MKYRKIRFTGIGIFVILVFSQTTNAQSSADQKTGWLTYPFSQLVVRHDWAAPIVWKYAPFKEII
jgi:hypothetical protein